MASFNQVTLMGNLTRDPEARTTSKGTHVCQIGLAMNRKWRNEAGQEQEEVTFVDVDAWGKQAEVLTKHLKKGDPLLLSGRLKTDQWEDKATGQKRSKLGVVLETFQFIGGGNKQDGQQARPAAPRAAAPAPASPAPSQRSAQPEEDDVPF